jgi:hypothetical protein
MTDPTPTVRTRPWPRVSPGSSWHEQPVGPDGARTIDMDVHGDFDGPGTPLVCRRLRFVVPAGQDGVFFRAFYAGDHATVDPFQVPCDGVPSEGTRRAQAYAARRRARRRTGVA